MEYFVCPDDLLIIFHLESKFSPVTHSILLRQIAKSPVFIKAGVSCNLILIWVWLLAMVIKSLLLMSVIWCETGAGKSIALEMMISTTRPTTSPL